MAGGPITLWELAKRFGLSWEPIAYQLDLKHFELENIKQNHPRAAWAFQVLLKWLDGKSNLSRQALEEKLHCAFQKVERQDLIYLEVDLSTEHLQFTAHLTPPAFNTARNSFNKDDLIRKLKSFVKGKMSKLPLIPWMSTGVVNVDQVFTNVQLLIAIATANLPIRLSLDSHNAIFDDISADDSNVVIDNYRKRILVRGRTGSGKTTLLTKYAYDWSMGKTGSLLCNVPIVFILPMRKLDHHSNLGQAVLDHMLPREKQINSAAIEQFCEDHPEDVVILLDGYDEFKGKGLDQEDCGNIVQMLRDECFTECQVVVTTRPGRVGDFSGDLYESYRHLEITGFSPKDIDDYVHKIFRGVHESLGNKLLHYLEENQLKEELASIPLMLTAFCQLAKWTDGKDFGELNTISKLFDRLVECMFQHESTKIDSGGKAHSYAARPLTPNELVRELGKVALGGFLGDDSSEELIFTEDDFLCCFDPVRVIEQGLRTGFLSKDEDSGMRPENYETTVRKKHKPSPKRNISFILKILQEKCAGNYLAYLLESGSEDVFTEYLQKVNTEQKFLDLKNLLVFSSAANTDAAYRIMSHIVDLLCNKQGDQIASYLRGKLHFKECPQTQRLIETCLQLNYESNSEGRYNHLFNRLFGGGSCIRLVRISTYVAKTLGYLFAHSGQRAISEDLRSTTTGVEERHMLGIRRLQLINIRLESSTQFREFLNCYPGSEEEIIKCMGDSVNISSQDVVPKLRRKIQANEQETPSYLSDRPDHVFRAIMPIWQEVNKQKIQDFSLGFVLTGLKGCSLHELVLNGVTAETRDLDKLIGMISDCTFDELTNLTLSLNNLTFEQTSRLATALESTPQLKYLKMSGNEVGDGFVDNLPHNLPDLENVILDNSRLSSEASVKFIRKLGSYPHLKKLDLRRNEDTDDNVIYAMSESLENGLGRNWTELRLSLYKVSEDGLDRFQRQIGQASNLTHLNLVHTPIPDKVIHYCALALTSLPNMVDLRISGNPKIDVQDSVPCMSQSVQSFVEKMATLKNITFLSFLYVNMTSKDLLKMLDCCGRHTSLKTFRFSQHYLPAGDDVERACKEAEKTFLQLWV